MKVFFLALFFPLTLTAQMKVIDTDRSMFRIKERVFFLSDLKKLKKGVELYRCLYGNSLTLSFAEVAKKNDLNDLTSPAQIKKMALLEQLNIFSQSKNVIVLDRVYAVLEESQKVNKCPSFDRRMVVDFARMEVFLSAQLKIEEEGLSKEELVQFKILNPDIKERQLKARLVAEKKAEAEKQFLELLNRQLPISYLYE